MAIITDNLNGVDQATLQGQHTWTESIAGWERFSNAARIDPSYTGGFSAAFINDATLDSGHQYAQAVLTDCVGLDGVAAAWGVALRDPGTGVHTRYAWRAVAAGVGNLFWSLTMVKVSVETGLGSWPTDPAQLDVFKITVERQPNGDDLVKGWVGGVVRVSQTVLAVDAISAANHHVGVEGYRNGAGVPPTGGLDTFEAGDLGQLLAPSGLASAEAFGTPLVSVAGGAKVPWPLLVGGRLL